MLITLPKTSSAVTFLLAAATLPISAGAATVPVFTITGPSTAAQTLGAGQNAISKDGSLTISGSTVAVTASANNSTLTNLGTISQTGSGRAIRDNAGVTNLVINNGSITNASATIKAADGDVIQMNKSPASVTLNNYGQLISYNASAGGSQVVDFAAILSGANVVNNFAGASMLATDADAVRTGVNGVVNNNGLIQSTAPAHGGSDGIDAQNNSGAQISNGAKGVIDGGRHGITGGQLDASSSFTMSVTNSAGGIIRGSDGSGINIDGVNNKLVVIVMNDGLISGLGVTGDGDGVDVDGIANITNTGTIRSINAFSAAGSGLAYSEGISIGGGTVVNSGTIEGLVSAGNNNAVGRGITLAGNDITSGSLAGTREGLYGNASITNQAGGLIRGQSDSAIVTVGAASGYTVTIINQAGGTIRGGGSANAAIKTAKDNTSIVNSGTIDGGSSGKAIEMGSGNNSLTISGGSASIIGGIDGGTGGVNTMVVNPGAGNSFTYAGAISNFNSVEFKSGSTTLTGVSSYTGTTLLSGGVLTLVGANRLSSNSALVLGGGELRLTNAGAAGQTFASLSLTGDSVVDLGSSSLTFNGLGAVVSGKTLSFTEAASGAYAFRLLGNYSADASFLALLLNTTVDGVAARYSFDGTYTGVSAVPEPSTYAMLFAGLGLVAAIARRRKKGDLV